MTTLEEVTGRVLLAVRQRNFEELNAALEERACLIASGAIVTRDVWQMGQEACEKLRALQHELSAESTRLERMRGSVTASPTHVDCRG